MPLPLSDHMFLGAEVPDLIDLVRATCPEHFHLAAELNHFANAWFFGTEPSKEDVRHVLVGTLLPRLLTAFQGSVIMAERGMSAEVRLLVRKVLEVCFRIAAISKDETHAYTYIRSDETNRRKYLNKLSSLKSIEHSPEEQAKIKRLQVEVTEVIKAKSIEEIGTQWFAERAGLMDLYSTAYALFSESAHANVRDLEPLILKTADGDIEGLEYGPDLVQLPDLLLTSIETTVIALEAAFTVLPGGDPVRLAALRREHDLLFERANFVG